MLTRANKMPAEEARGLIARMADKAFEELSRNGERKFLGGNKSSLLNTIYLFLDCGRTPPEWACKEFVAAVRSNPRSWDDVFDGPKKRKHWDGEVRRAGIAGRMLYDRTGIPIGDDFFERLALELKTSAATAKRRYYNSSISRNRSEGRFSKIIGYPRRDLGREHERLIPLIDAYLDAHPEIASQETA